MIEVNSQIFVNTRQQLALALKNSNAILTIWTTVFNSVDQPLSTIACNVHLHNISIVWIGSTSTPG